MLLHLGDGIDKAFEWQNGYQGNGKVQMKLRFQAWISGLCGFFTKIEKVKLKEL